MTSSGGGCTRTFRLAASLVLFLASAALPSAVTGQQPARQLPPAIYTDPPHDSAHPARMEVLHIPAGGVRINGIAYIPPGPGPHPTLVLVHGLPGNEKDLDLAQAVRRAGWTVVTFFYRGSWGSPGSFRFAHCLEDADAVLAYVHEPANVRALAIDTGRMVLAGHSMGGWVTALTTTHHPELLGAIIISGADQGAGRRGRPSPAQRSQLVEHMRDNMESLAGVTAEEMADEVIANGDRFEWTRAATGLARLPLLVLTADDGLAPNDVLLADSVRTHGGTRVTVQHVATDHAWSDRRIELQALVLRWLAELR